MRKAQLVVGVAMVLAFLASGAHLHRRICCGQSYGKG